MPVGVQNVFSSHGGLLTIVSSQKNNLIKLTHYDGTQKKANVSQIVKILKFHAYLEFIAFYSLK